MDMKELTLITGQVSLVDDEDFDRLSKFRWYLSARTVKRTQRQFYKTLNIPIAKEILSIVGSSCIVDHIDRNPLNNQKSNLRLCDKFENASNRIVNKTNTASKYRGVDWRCDRNKWRVKAGKVYIGLFSDEIEAAKAYDKYAKQFFGEFAVLNFPNP